MSKVLLITHDDLLAKAYGARLTKVGLQVERRVTGHDGLVSARQQPPQLILLDLALPGMHGLDVVKSLRDVPWLVKVPVVLLIEHTLDPEVVRECFLWGVKSVLEKDLCSVDEIVSHVHALLQPPTQTPSPSTV